MEQSAMKLLVTVIFVVALLYVFFTVIGPAYIWTVDPEPVINEGLGRSETELGQYSTKPGFFSNGYTVQAVGFESDSRSIVFECNNPVYCCEEDAECNKAIEWSNSGVRYFAIQEDKEIDISTRCRYDELYICKVFLGAEPAQVDLIKEPDISEEVDISESKTLPLNFTVGNSGKKGMSGTIASAKLFKIKKMPFGQDPEKVLVEEFLTEEFSLSPEDEIDPELEVEIPGNGDYLIEFTVFESSDETNFESKEFEFTATGDPPIAVCVPGKMKIQELEKCVYLLPCNCPSVTECTSAWRAALKISKTEELELVSADEESVTLQYKSDYRVPEWCDPETMDCEEYCEKKEIPEPVCGLGQCIEDEANCRTWLTCNCDPGADPNGCRELWTQRLGARNFLQGTYAGKPALYLPGSNKVITQIFCDDCGRFIPKEIDCCELPAVDSCGGNTCTDSITPQPTPVPTPQLCADGVPRTLNCVNIPSECIQVFPCVCMDFDQCKKAWIDKMSDEWGLVGVTPGFTRFTGKEWQDVPAVDGVVTEHCPWCEEKYGDCRFGLFSIQDRCTDST